MSENTQKPAKNYVNGMWVKERKFDDGGSIIKLDCVADKLIEWLKANKNERGYVNIVLSAKREPDEKSTHTAYLDTWVPKTQTGQAAPKPQLKAAAQKNTAPKPVVEDDENMF